MHKRYRWFFASIHGVIVKARKTFICAGNFDEKMTRKRSIYKYVSISRIFFRRNSPADGRFYLVRERLRFLGLIYLVLLFPAWADQLIIEPEMGREPVIHAIKQSQHSLNLTMYGFTDEQILAAILQQKSKGKKIKILLEEAPYLAREENIKTFTTFRNNKIDYQTSLMPFHLIHEKVLIIDDNKALIMTFNFTHGSFGAQRNFALVIDDPIKVKAIKSIFNADWSHQASLPRHEDILLSPIDSRKKVLSLIQGAHQSIQIYAQSISDYQVIGAVAKAARQGIKVKILTARKITRKRRRYFADAGVELRQGGPYYIHAKVIIIDNKAAVIGSLNLTRASLEKNRELALITHDKAVIGLLQQTFKNDWQIAQKDEPNDNHLHSN